MHMFSEFFEKRIPETSAWIGFHFTIHVNRLLMCQVNFSKHDFKMDVKTCTFI